MDNTKNQQLLSEWLLQNLKVEDQTAALQAVESEEVSPDDIVFEENLELPRVGRQAYTKSYSYSFTVYGLYSKYGFTAYGFSFYSFAVYNFSVYGFSNYSFSVYSFGDYAQYSLYSKYTQYSLYTKYSQYSLYSFTYSLYTQYSKYTQYSLYTDYYFAYCATCQICNTCQGKCETAQKVSDYIGTFSFDETMESGTEITDDDWNKMVNWIKTGAPYNEKSAPAISTVAGDNTEQLAKERFNEVNAAIPETFVDGATGLSDKSSGAEALASDLVTLASTLNKSKINSGISCCQTSGGQTCITCQDKCQGCQDQREV